jgi:predicted outer membrane repeat protein
MSDKCTLHGGGRCIEAGCKNGGVMLSNRCKKHGGGAICTEDDCNDLAYWTGEKISDKCWMHKVPRCVEPGCILEVNMKGEMCYRHKHGRCNEPDCNEYAKDATGKCLEHDNTTPRCNEPNCRAFVKYNGDKCKEHGGYQCSEPGCKTGAAKHLGLLIGKPPYKCVRHGGGYRCIEAGCNKGAIHIPGGGGYRVPSKCTAHGGGKRCPNCITWPDSRGGQDKYDGYCATCFKQVFPNDERSKVIYTHTKEIRVRNTINQHFEGFIHDKPLYTGECDCTMRRRIDHRKLIGATLLCVETDEFAHKAYDAKDEEIRYDDLFMVHSGKWVFIRFNPDGKGVDMDDKLTRLVEEIRSQTKRIENEENAELLEVIKLFY